LSPNKRRQRACTRSASNRSALRIPQRFPDV